MTAFNVLDPETDIDTHLILEASAGCGKTFAIEHLTARLLKKGFKLSQIVITTFTKKGAADLKERIFANLKKEGLKVDLDEAVITTLHGFSHKLLLEDPLDSDEFYENLLTAGQKEKIIMDFMKGLDEKWPVDVVASHMKLIKNGLKSGALPEFEEILKDFTTYFNDLKMSEAFFEYDDLIHGLHKRIKDPLKLKKLQNRFKIGIIDEFQDTDAVQWEIFSSLFLHEQGRLYLVGDPKQSIYAFRDADIYTYITAQNSLGVEAKRTLSTNYRSDPSLLVALDKFFHIGQKPSFFNLPKLASCLPNPSVLGPAGKIDSACFDPWHKLQFFYTESSKNQAEIFFNFMAARIQELAAAGVPYANIAILVDRNSLSYTVQDALQAWNIPSHVHQEKEDELRPAIRILNKINLAAESPKNDKLIKEALLTPFFNWTSDELLSLDDLFFKEKIVWQFMQLAEALKKGQPSFIGALLACRLKDYSVREEILKRNDGEEWLVALENAMLSPKEESLSKPAALVFNEGVQILTLHKSKGLEFDVVFPLGLGLRRKDRPDEEDPEEVLAEKMRLLYVALTRAKRQLFIPLDMGKKNANIKTVMDYYFAQALDKTPAKVTLQDLRSLGLNLAEAAGTESILRRVKEKTILTPPELFNSEIKLLDVLSFSKIKKPHAKEKAADLLINEIEDLPKGAETGLFFHELYEKVPLSLCAEAKDYAAYLPFVSSFTKNTAWDCWKERVAAILYESFNTLHAPLRFMLKDVLDRQSYREIEFLESHAAGFMKGVIDWLFVHDNQYYIVDWKSNYAHDYTEESLQRMMRDDDYNLQAEIYKNAAERYFKRFPEITCGGVYYYFLRGGKLWKAL